MHSPLTSSDELSSAWLTSALIRSRLLTKGNVASFSQKKNSGASNSDVSHITVSYSDAVPKDVPTTFVLKIKKEHTGSAEVSFYNDVYDSQDDLPMLVTMYDAQYNADNGTSHVLLEDVSMSHVPSLTRAKNIQGDVPSPRHLDQIITSLATFHAFWWNNPRLRANHNHCKVSNWYQTEKHFSDHIERRKRELKLFTAKVGDWFPAQHIELYETVLEQLPQLWDKYLKPRISSGNNLTLTHGDCYFSQFFCPTDDEVTFATMIDFDSVCVDFGAVDLVFLLTTFWSSEVRKENNREEMLLRRYLEVLQNNGLRDYTWDDLMRDYKLMITLMIYFPVWDCLNGSPKSYYYPKAQNLLAAFHDHDCRSLFVVT